MMQSILALDIGATNIKAALFDAEGNILRQDCLLYTSRCV